jgi:hypothetical protein
MENKKTLKYPARTNCGRRRDYSRLFIVRTVKSASQRIRNLYPLLHPLPDSRRPAHNFACTSVGRCKQAHRIRLAFSHNHPLLGLLIIISFYTSCIDRIRQAYQTGSILAFSSTAVKSKFIEYSNQVINGDVKQRVISAQNQVPPGQPIVVLTGAPFYLDYKRNTIYDAERSGIATPWASIPDANYFVLRYKGTAVHTLGEYLRHPPGKREMYISEKCIAFLRFFQDLRKTADVIYNDGTILVIRKCDLVPD